MSRNVAQAAAFAALIAYPTFAMAADNSSPAPSFEHMAVWTADIDKTAAFLNSALGWRRHPLVFGVREDSKEFGGMKLAFVDANGLWLELVQPTTPGPGMDLLKEKGDGALVELDMSVPDFDKNVAAMKAKGIELVGMDGKPLTNGGILTEWVLEKNGLKTNHDERLSYLPLDVSRGTSVELFWEYPSGVLGLRDAMWASAPKPQAGTPRIAGVTLLAKDLAKSTNVYTGILGLKRIAAPYGVRSDWMGVGDSTHAWVKANTKNATIEVVAPPPTAKGANLVKEFGDGMIMELEAEVPNIDAFYDRMKAKGITLTDGNGKPLEAGVKSVATATPVARYAYFPLSASAGMRIMVFQKSK